MNKNSARGNALDSELGGQLSFRASVEDERKQRRREKRQAEKDKQYAEQKKDMFKKEASGLPQVELIQLSPLPQSTKHQNGQHTIANKKSMHSSFNSSKDITGEEINLEDTLQNELMIEEVDINIGNDFFMNPIGDAPPMSGEEYFETNPNDTSYDIDNTNRDLVSGPNDYTSPAVMISPDKLE
jgi:hypothetical protein